MVVSSQSTAVANRFPAFPQTMPGTKPKAQPLQIRVYRLEEPSRCNSKRIRIPR